MMTTTFLTFLTSDNLFLHDICSYFLFLKSVLSCLFPVKSKKPNMGGETVDNKMQGQVLDSNFGKMVGDHYKMIFRVKSNSLLQLSTIKHNRVTFQNLIHTFGDLKLKILPQKCILYLFSKLTTCVSLENITFRASLWDVYKMFWGCCGKSYNFETANSLVFQAQIW